MEAGPVKAEAGVIGSPTAVPGMDSDQHEKVFYGMALKTLAAVSRFVCNYRICLRKMDGFSADDPASIDCGWNPKHCTRTLP